MIAYLIICHKNANQIIRLIDRIKTNNADIFLHIDPRMKSDEFLYLSGHFDSVKGIYLLPERLQGKLDDRSLVDITMSCINSARNIEREERKHYQYFLLLSGQDYPIKPVQWIEEQLIKTYPKPFIDCTQLSKSNWVAKKFNRNATLIKYRNWVLLHTDKGGVQKIMQLIGVIARKGLYYLRLTTAQRMKKQGTELYGGSAWWILPDDVIEYIWNEYENRGRITHILLNESVTPEETFFQTMAKRSPFKDRIVCNEPDAVYQNCKTFADFGKITKRPIANHPYVLTLNEFDVLREPLIILF